MADSIKNLHPRFAETITLTLHLGVAAAAPAPAGDFQSELPALAPWEMVLVESNLRC